MDQKQIERLTSECIMLQTKRTVSVKAPKISERYYPGRFSWKALGMEAI